MNQMVNPFRARRLALGLTVTDVATRLGVSVSYVARFERGGRGPSARLIPQLAAVYGQSPESVAYMAEQQRLTRRAGELVPTAA